MTAQSPRQKAFTTFWLYRASSSSHRAPESERSEARDAIVSAFSAASDVELRAAYSTVGLTAGVDLILWLVAEDVEAFQKLAVAIHRSPAKGLLEAAQAYLGVASMSQY